MANSSKHRAHIAGVIRELRKIGCDVTLEQGDKNKLRITYGGKSRMVVASATPKNRHSAQRAIIGDINHVLGVLGVPEGRLESQGLLHMMTNSPAERPDLEDLARGLERDHEIPSELVGDILELAAVLAEMGGMSPRGTRGMSPHARPIVAGACTILTPEPATTPPTCTKVVGVYLAEKGNFRKQFTAGKGLEALIDYYGRCRGIVRIGLVVSETWNPKTLGSFEVPIEYYESIGIKTIFVLSAGNRLIPMNFPWR